MLTQAPCASGFSSPERIFSARAERACRMNGLEDDIDFVCSDIKDIDASGVFDAVLTNPPYFRRTPDEPGAADPDERYTARHETTADIGDFTRISAAMLKEGKSYQEVTKETGVSAATICRVNKCLLYGTGGYRAALEAEEGEGK